MKLRLTLNILIVLLIVISFNSCSSTAPVAHNFKFFDIDKQDYTKLQYYTSVRAVYKKTERGATQKTTEIDEGKVLSKSKKMDNIDLLVIPARTPCKCINFGEGYWESDLFLNHNVVGAENSVYYFDMEFSNGLVLRYAILGEFYDMKFRDFFETHDVGELHNFIMPNTISQNGERYRYDTDLSNRLVFKQGIYFKGKKSSKKKTRKSKERIKGNKIY